MTFKTFMVSVVAKCGFSKFVGDSCGHGASSADTQCIRLVLDSTLKNEVQLIFARVGIVPNYAFHQRYLYLMLT